MPKYIHVPLPTRLNVKILTSCQTVIRQPVTLLASQIQHKQWMLPVFRRPPNLSSRPWKTQPLPAHCHQSPFTNHHSPHACLLDYYHTTISVLKKTRRLQAPLVRRPIFQAPSAAPQGSKLTQENKLYTQISVFLIGHYYALKRLRGA